MKVVIEEFVISGENISKEQGRIYEVIGLDVVYDSHNIRIYSTNKARIMSLGGGIHIHALYSTQKKLRELGLISKDLDHSKSSPFEILDNLGNKILITFIGEHPNNSIAIITSGGDAPGMNAAIKGIIRSAIKYGSTVYGVYRGFDGLIEDYICKLGWDTETHSSAEGGTVLLSFRSKSFFKREVRKEAVFNLIKRNINCLIILGGDGSLKGALTLKNEFQSLFRELIKEGRLTQEDLQIIYEKYLNLKKSFMDFDEIEHYEKFYGEPECYKALPKINASKYPPLESNGSKSEGGKSEGNYDDDKGKSDDKGNDKDDDKGKSTGSNKSDDNDKNDYDDLIYDLKIIGIPSSIDNDIWGTDYTLGADTALNRIIESIDHLSSTMKSHQRIFVIEVMGRSCGWLALMSGLSCLSDYVLIPEDPPEDWRKEVMDKVFFAKNHGKPGIFIVISEGACDKKGIKIPSMDVVNHIASFNIDVRLLKLGHIQRGGPTSAFDRILGTLMGIKAHELSTEMNNNESKIVVYSNGEIQTKNLNTVIEMIDKIGIYEKNLNFKEVLKSRGCFYNLAYSFYKEFLEGKSKVDAPFMEDVNLKTSLEDNPKLQKKFENKKKSKMNEVNGEGSCKSGNEVNGKSCNEVNGKVNSKYEGYISKGINSSNEKNEPNIENNKHNQDNINNNLTSNNITIINNHLFNNNNFINNRILLKDKKKIGILQCGSRSSGMNTALNSIIQYSFTVGFEPVYILNGFDGLQQEQIISSKLYEFSTDYNNGGASLGLCGLKYVNLENIKKVLIKKGIENLIIIGDSECLEIVEGICGKGDKGKSEYKIDQGKGDSREYKIDKGKGDKSEFKIEVLNTLNPSLNPSLNTSLNTSYIPSSLNTSSTQSTSSNPFLNIILIPAASSNNIPNTDISLGVDTALNTILRVSDCAKLSTFSMKKNVFVLEVAGGNSGYLTLMGGIAAGAFDCFIPERKYLIGHLSETAHRLRNRFKESKRHGIVIFRNEKTFCSISTESFCRVLKTDGKGLFETDFAVMGRLQQGLNPSPIDRVNATLLGIKAVKCCLENSGGGLVGIEGDKIVFTDIKTALKNFDLKTRTVKNPKWIKYSNVTKSIE